MKIVSHWTAMAVALLALNIAAQVAVIYVSLVRRIKLVMLPILAGFLFLSDVAGIALASLVNVDKIAGVLWYSRAYWIYYWTCAVVGCALLVMLAFEIATEIMPEWKAPVLTVWGLSILLFLLASVYRVLPSGVTNEVLSIPSFADIMAACSLLVVIISPSPVKRKGFGIAAAGVIVSVSLHLAASILFVRDGISNRAVTGLGIQFASLAGMMVFYVAARCLPSRPLGGNFRS